MRTRVIVLMAVAAIVSVELGAASQTSKPPAGVATPSVATAARKPQVTPEQHLAEAKQALEGMSSSPRQRDVRDRLADLRKTFDEMASAYATGAQAPHGPKDLTQVTPIVWRNKFFDIEKDLALLIGGGSSPVADSTASAAASGTSDKNGVAPVVGTSGTTAQTSQLVAAQGVKPLPEGANGVDPGLRSELERFRTELEFFYDSTTTHDYEARPSQP
jgi:hypothetical protein